MCVGISHIKKVRTKALRNLKIRKAKREALTCGIEGLEAHKMACLVMDWKVEPEAIIKLVLLDLIEFTNAQARQATIQNIYKEQQELVVKKIGRCIYANELSFNIS